MAAVVPRGRHLGGGGEGGRPESGGDDILKNTVEDREMMLVLRKVELAPHFIAYFHDNVPSFPNDHSLQLNNYTTTLHAWTGRRKASLFTKHYNRRRGGNF